MIPPGETGGGKSDFKDLRLEDQELQTGHPHCSPAKIMDQGPLEHISGPIQEMQVIRKSQNGFTNGQSHLNNPIALYDKMAEFTGKGRTVDDFDLAVSTCQPLSILSSFS